MNENREQHILDKLIEEEVPLNNIKLDQINRIIPKSILIVDYSLTLEYISAVKDYYIFIILKFADKN